MSSKGKSASTTQSSSQSDPVNAFQIIVATVNGTGSQTANIALIRALFRMGIPVNGKNIFPSNIQGLPTWFTIRLSREGYVARRDTSEVLVAMNQATIMDDIRDLPPDGVCFYPEEWAIRHERTDVVYYAMPVKTLMSGMDIPANLRDYVVNMTYVGFVSALLGIEINEVEAALNIHFKGKASAVALNMKVANAAYEWAMDNVAKQDIYSVKRLEKTSNKIILDGNSAAALGAVFGGVTMAAWYPITPSTSLIDSLKEYLADLRHDADGKATYAIVQAEDELAAIGMVVGASWAGARAMTATSGPGLSLMTEFVGFAYFTEIPAVIWDVQRIGPSTGLPTRTAQGDLLAAYFMGHGDTKHVCLLPSNISECFEFGWRSFDLAERLQTPVFVLSDLDLGMNLWMSDPFEYPSEAIDRGKVLTAEDLEKLGEFGRYKDVDGDGIPYRTLPGTNHPKAAYFTRGSGHNENAEYSERPKDWANNMMRLGRKFDTARSIVPQPVVSEVKGAKIGLIAYGSSDPAIIEGRDRLDAKGIKTSYLRLRALPLNDITRKFIAKYDHIYVVDNNTDGQMYKLLCMEYPDIAGKMQSLASSTGLPLSARWLAAEVSKKEGVK